MRTSESKSVPILEEVVEESYLECTCYEHISVDDFENEHDYYTQIRFALQHFSLA